MLSDILPQHEPLLFTLPFHLISFLVFDHISAYPFNPPFLLFLSAPFSWFNDTMLPHRCLIRKSDFGILHNVPLKHTSPLPRNETAYTLCITWLWHCFLLLKCRQAGITALSLVIMQGTVIIYCLRGERGIGGHWAGCCHCPMMNVLHCTVWTDTTSHSFICSPHLFPASHRITCSRRVRYKVLHT